MSMDASPSWARTSVDWLEQNTPYVTTSSHLPAKERLERALRKASYLMEMEGVVPAGGRIAQLVEAWDLVQHERMVSYFKSGGYTAAKKRVDMERELAKKADDLDKETAKEMRKFKAKAKEKAGRPAGIPVAKPVVDELEEIIEAVSAERYEADPNKGVW